MRNLLDKVPMEIEGPNGTWVGQDVLVPEKVRNTAGAEGYVNRIYVNDTTNHIVKVWLIVGHYRDIVRHTPDICYKAQGAKQIDHDKSRYQGLAVPATAVVGEDGIVVGDAHTFYTTKFGKPDELGSWDWVERVYWAWWKPEPLEDGQTLDSAEISWVAPENPRLEFKYPRALYKLYFTVASTPEGTPDHPVAAEFAELFVPIANEIIADSGRAMMVPLDDQAIADREEEIKLRREQLEDQIEAARKEAEGRT